MSTKVYYGWLFDFSHLSLFIDTVRTLQLRRIVKMAKTWVSASPDEMYTHRNKIGWAMNSVREAAKNPFNSLYDITCGWDLYIHPDETSFMAYPWGPIWLLPSRLPSPFQNFQYWNNVDPPTGMNEEEWDARGRAWDSVLDAESSGKKRRLTLLVWDTKNHSDVYYLEQKMLTYLKRMEGVKKSKTGA